jgi:hypothetical protein
VRSDLPEQRYQRNLLLLLTAGRAVRHPRVRRRAKAIRARSP